MGRTAEPDRNFYRSLSYEIKEWEDIFSTVHLVFDSGTGNFFLMLFLAMGIRIRKIVAAFFLLWTGMSGGILLSEAVAELGIKGSILCVAGLFPQFLFYVPAVLVLLRFCWNYPQNQWNRQKTFFVCGLFLIGIFSESCLNPWLIQQIVNILFWFRGKVWVMQRDRQLIDWWKVPIGIL